MAMTTPGVSSCTHPVHRLALRTQPAACAQRYAPGAQRCYLVVPLLLLCFNFEILLAKNVIFFLIGQPAYANLQQSLMISYANGDISVS